METGVVGVFLASVPLHAIVAPVDDTGGVITPLQLMEAVIVMDQT